MAKRIQVHLDDDIDGTPAVETIKFALDGTQYEIDLSAKNAASLRKALDRYVKHARPLRQPKGRARSAGRAADTSTIREWARANGLEVSDRGRVSQDVLAAYRAAN